MKNDEMWTLTNFREALADAEQWEIVNLFPGFKMPEWVRKLFTTAAKLVEQWFATDNDAEASHGLGTKATQSFEEAGEALSKALRGFFHGSSKHFSERLRALRIDPNLGSSRKPEIQRKIAEIEQLSKKPNFSLAEAGALYGEVHQRILAVLAEQALVDRLRRKLRELDLDADLAAIKGRAVQSKIVEIERAGSGDYEEVQRSLAHLYFEQAARIERRRLERKPAEKPVVKHGNH